MPMGVRVRAFDKFGGPVAAPSGTGSWEAHYQPAAGNDRTRRGHTTQLAPMTAAGLWLARALEDPNVAGAHFEQSVQIVQGADWLPGPYLGVVTRSQADRGQLEPSAGPQPRTAALDIAGVVQEATNRPVLAVWPREGDEADVQRLAGEIAGGLDQGGDRLYVVFDHEGLGADFYGPLLAQLNAGHVASRDFMFSHEAAAGEYGGSSKVLCTAPMPPGFARGPQADGVPLERLTSFHGAGRSGAQPGIRRAARTAAPRGVVPGRES